MEDIMYIARIKFKVQPIDSYTPYELYTLYTEGEIYCKYRYTKDNCFEFFLGDFVNKEVAFEKGKILYSSLLYLLSLEEYPYNLEVLNFDGQVKIGGHHLNQRGIGIEPDKFYFSNKFFFNNYYGLEIFEFETDFFKEYNDSDFNQQISFELSCRNDYKYRFELLQKIKIPYNENCYRIYKILELFNQTDDTNIKILILSIAFETLAGIELEEIKTKSKSSSLLEEFDCTYIDKFFQTQKKESIVKTCNLLIEKYSTEFQKDKKIFKEFYNIRSLITHGSQIPKDINAFDILQKAKSLFLKIFKIKFNLK